jgi:hypothetical protein
MASSQRCEEAPAATCKQRKGQNANARSRLVRDALGPLKDLASSGDFSYRDLRDATRVGCVYSGYMRPETVLLDSRLKIAEYRTIHCCSFCDHIATDIRNMKSCLDSCSRAAQRRQPGQLYIVAHT